MAVMEQLKPKVLIRCKAIEKRVGEVARQITRDFAGERVHLIGVSSYGKGKESSGQVKLLKDLDSSIAGLNVILVEDILDTGITLSYLLRILRQRRPKVLRVA